MQVTSMYETLMELPLFRGVGHEQISKLIERFHLEFNTFLPGSQIMAFNESCNSAKCVLSGEVEILHSVMDGRLLVREAAGKGRCLGLERLFGLENHNRFEVRAITRSGTLDISKQQYMELLRTEQIYLMNILNYLSLSVQRYSDILINSKNISIASLLAMIIGMTTSRKSREITIELGLGYADRPILEILTGIIPVDNGELDRLCHKEIIDCSNPNKIKIIDRMGLINCSY